MNIKLTDTKNVTQIYNRLTHAFTKLQNCESTSIPFFFAKMIKYEDV